jgi:hypothetical protein
VAGGTWSNDGDVNGNHGNEDFWIVKVQPNGTKQWQKCLGGSNYEEAHCILQTKDGGYIAAGDTQSNEGDISGNHGSVDFWVVKLSGISNPPSVPVILSRPNPVIPGVIYNFSAVSSDPDGDQVKYTFDWGDGRTSVTSFVNSGTKANASQSWSRAGTYKVTAYATDSKGALSGWSEFLIVTVKNPLDTPKFGNIADLGYVGLPLGFFASTGDNNSNQVTYTFDWGDNTNNIVTTLTNTSATVKVFHTWNRTGSYQIKTKATNRRGDSSEWSDPLTITIIANNPPNLPSAPSGPVSGLTGTAYTYSFSASDPDLDRIMYTVDWGDGTTSVTGFAVYGMIMSESHSWGKAGNYKIKVKGTDSRGSSSGWSTTLNATINTPPMVPTKPFGNVSGYAWVLYGFSTYATDPDADNVKYTFDWGDGTSSTTNFINSRASASSSHSWSKAGVYLVTTNVTDSKGASSGWSNPLVIVISANSPPNTPATSSGSTTGYTGISYSYSASATDPNADNVKYTLDWGNGMTSDTSLVNSGAIANASHSWSKAGTFNVKAMATDSKGATSGWSSPLTVTINAPNQAKLVGADDASCDGSAGPANFHLCRFQAVSSGVVNTIMLKASGSGNVKVAIYADNSGAPGALLSAASGGISVNAGWNNIGIPSLPVTNGAYYWLAFDSDVGLVCLKVSPGLIYWKAAPYGTFTFPSQVGSGFSQTSVYTGLIAGWNIIPNQAKLISAHDDKCNGCAESKILLPLRPAYSSA